MNEAVSKKSKYWVIIVSVVLVVALCLSVIIYNPFCIKDLARIAVQTVTGTVVVAGLMIAIGLEEGFIHIKYNQQWIKNHSKEEIIAKYGEFDYYHHNVGYYKKREISSVSFEAVAIYFNTDETVLRIDMDSSFGYPGG